MSLIDAVTIVPAFVLYRMEVRYMMCYEMLPITCYNTAVVCRKATSELLMHSA
jgi:hypothetical protein